MTNKKFMLIAGMFFLTAIFGTSCGNVAGDTGNSAAPESGGMAENNLDVKLGGSEERNIILDASKVQECIVEQKSVDSIVALILGTDDYKKEHTEFIQQVKEMMNESGLSAESKIYASATPIFEWLAETNEVIYSYPSIVVFSEDYKNMWRFQLILEDGQYESYSFGNMESKILDALNKDENREYIYWGAYEQEELLSDENERTIINGMNSNTVKVVGNYFQKLESSGISISMKKLKENRIELKVN